MSRYLSQESIHRSRLAAPHHFPRVFESMSPLASDDTAVDHLDGAQDSIDANVLTQPNLLESSNAYR